MTVNEIVKALECCVNLTPCKECPLESDGGCRDTIIEQSLSLVNRQREEIKTLKPFRDAAYQALENSYFKIKAEAYKEFANIVKSLTYSVLRMYCNVDVISEFNYRVDNIVKEMVCATNNPQPEHEAHWIISSDGYYPYCSECGDEPQDGEMAEFCPNCLAKMSNPR